MDEGSWIDCLYAFFSGGEVERDEGQTEEKEEEAKVVGRRAVSLCFNMVGRSLLIEPMSILRSTASNFRPPTKSVPNPSFGPFGLGMNVPISLFDGRVSSQFGNRY
ncbi:hypothetical protein E2542_SST20332 [Spatholobus suberectus]|nr:hypothetical protein E2542_SST20332 [Spatholobus suberectus]